MNVNRDHTLVPWDTIDTVLLDMDGTLLDLNYDNQFFAPLTVSLCGLSRLTRRGAPAAK